MFKPCLFRRDAVGTALSGVKASPEVAEFDEDIVQAKVAEIKVIRQIYPFPLDTFTYVVHAEQL